MDNGFTIFPPEVFFLSSLPSRTNPSEVIAIVAVAMGLSFLATLYPAWRAGRSTCLQAALTRPRLFRTDAFETSYSQQARLNMDRELESLS